MLLFRNKRRVAVFAVLALTSLGLAVVAQRAATWRPKICQFPSSSIGSLQWSPDGSQLKVYKADNFGRESIILNGRTLEIEGNNSLSSLSTKYGLEIAADEKTVALAGEDDTKHGSSYPEYWVGLANARTGKLNSRITTCNFDWLSFSPDSKRLFFSSETCGPGPAGEHGEWGLIEIADQKFKRMLARTSDSVQRVVWTHDGQSVWFAQSGGEVDRVTRDGKRRQSFKVFPFTFLGEREVTALALTPDEKTLALATVETSPKSFANSITIIDTRTGHVINSWHPTTVPTGLACAPRTNQLAVSDDQTVTLYSWRQKSPPRILPVPDVSLLAYSPNGSHLALGRNGKSGNGEVQVWRIQ